MRRPEREKLASASKLLHERAVAIIGYPCRHVPYVPLLDAALPPRDTHPPPYDKPPAMLTALPAR
ncbi:hypothetical protein [uncultured Campylobacter sp.]|uniref:hypothetical protein n=1 Tax=uncultured Campylobacter sp. TaxID=218934 RepID=UPI002609FD80|nr:hypothetical protein [uncultured Campylobacter sp.]